MKPSEVSKDNETIVFYTLFSTIGNATSTMKFNIGDRVRIIKFKDKFHYKYDSNWTREIFTVNQILKTNLVTYKIKDSNNEIMKGNLLQP